MSTIRGVKDRRFNFVQLLNSMFEDQKISLKAKGFIGYCLTKTEDWKFHISHLMSVLKEGETAIYSVINECIDNGYAFRYQARGPDGKLLPGEFIISDSKNEIQCLKNEYESKQEFKKNLPHRENQGTVSPHRENPDTALQRETPGAIYSNTDSSNTEEKQQQEPQKSTQHNLYDQTPNPSSAAAASFYKELKDIDMPLSDKTEITKTYSIQNVKHGLLWLEKNDKPLTKGVAAALKWACKTLPEIPKPKKIDKTPVDPASFNKTYFRQINNIAQKNGIKLYNAGLREGTTDYLETENDKIYYKDVSFLDQIANFLRKKSIECRNVFEMIKACQMDLAKQI